MTIANLYHCDGFEIQFADNSAGLFDGVDIDDGQLSYGADYLRTGNGALRINTANGYDKAAGMVSLPGLTSVYAGFSLTHLGNLETVYSEAIAIFALNSGVGGITDRRLSLGIGRVNHNLLLFADDETSYGWPARGFANSTPAALGTAIIGAGELHYVEIFSSRTSVVVRVDGVEDINYSRADNGDVYSVAQLGVARANGTYSDHGGQGDFYFDDFVLADDWPNGARIEFLTPDADGSHSDWDSTGANDHGEIDELNTYGNLPDTESYLSHAVAGERVSVGLEDLASADVSVLGIMPIAYLQNAGGGQQMAQFLQTAGGPQDLTTFVSPATWEWRKDPLVLNPETEVNFTPAQINSLELGWKVVD